MAVSISGSGAITGMVSADSSDLSTALAAKGDIAGETWTGTHDFTGATVNGVGGGLAHILTQAFSAASTINVNNVFDATYDNYMVAVRVDSGSASANIKLRMRASGTDNATNYLFAVFYGTKGAAAGNAQFASESTYGSSAELQLIDYDATVGGQSFLTIGRPALAKPTWLSSPYQKVTAGTVAGGVTGIHNVSSAFDGFTLFSSSGTVTGSLSVYGMAI